MPEPSLLDMSGWAALGALGSVCAVLLRTTHHNLKTLEEIRREAVRASDELRGELRNRDQTITELQALWAQSQRSSELAQSHLERLEIEQVSLLEELRLYRSGDD